MLFGLPKSARAPSLDTSGGSGAEMVEGALHAL